MTDHVRLVGVTFTRGDPFFGLLPCSLREPVLENAADGKAEADTRGLNGARHRSQHTGNREGKLLQIGDVPPHHQIYC